MCAEKQQIGLLNNCYREASACFEAAVPQSFRVLFALQEVSLASCVFEGDGLSACTAGSTASFRLRACDARGYTVASATADFTLTVVVDGKDIPGANVPHESSNLARVSDNMQELSI